MELCLGENNPQAHYIQGMHDYFHNNNTKKRLDHLRRSADVMCDNEFINYEGTNLHIIVNLTDYNPHAIHKIDVDIVITDLYATIGTHTTEEEDELCTICIDNIVREDVVNSFSCNHIFHNQGIVDWFRSNLSCPTY
ncbi:hypothetical protein Bca101_025737 [Brassica carinata]